MPTNTHDGGPRYQDIQNDIAAMGEALIAISRIPTQRRRRIAFDWLVARVNDDLRKLAAAEHEERVVALVGAIFGEDDRPAPAEPLSPKERQDAHLDTFGGER